jgi:hypothetical protein
MRNTLSNMLLGEKPIVESDVKNQKESAPTPISAPLQTTLPEPPVVVHVKPVSKTSP